MNRRFMRSLLVEESFAYGFTIAFWGAGVLLFEAFGPLRTVAIVEYAAGAITGFGVLAVASFGGAIDTVDVEEPPNYVILAGIHYLSALVPIVLAHLLIGAALGKGMTLFLTGAAVSVGYNLFAALEETLSELAWAAERRWFGS